MLSDTTEKIGIEFFVVKFADNVIILAVLKPNKGVLIIMKLQQFFYFRIIKIINIMLNLLLL